MLLFHVSTKLSGSLSGDSAMLRLNAMDLPASSATPHPLRNRTAGSLMLLVTLATGCASPGNPRPPSLYLPALVTDLTAQRVGDQVQLHWTTPARTTDGLELKGALTAEFCRQTGPSAPCDTITRLPVQPGPSQA